MSEYYDGTKLLSLMDKNGDRPEIYICTSNRASGKTVYFNSLLIRRFKKKKEKFCLLYRYVYELDECAEKFFKDISTIYYPNDLFTSEKKSRGTYHNLYLNGEHCGYAMAINSADAIKKMAHRFNDVKYILLDEFQSETNTYVVDEIKKFISIHTSIARGRGEQARYVPVYLVGNPVSILNPYYVKMKISNILTPNVHYLRGEGWVLEQGYNESASQAMKKSAFNRAFADDDYIAYAADGKYINDDYSFVEKMNGSGRYVATVKYKNCLYAIREYQEEGIIYIDDKPDPSFPMKIVVTTEDHDINYIMLKNNAIFLMYLRSLFEKGCFRFKNLKCKEALLCALSY